MIFAIKPFEIHDGDGIRTTVFFKGCPLRCQWCHNPESWSPKKELLFDAELCRDCLKCVSLCDAHIQSGTSHLFERKNCTACEKCVSVCPSGALEIAGMELSAEEIAEEALKDELFMKGSGGGVTFSGGEPLMQVDLCVDVARRIKARGVNLAIDTCGAVPRSAIDQILPFVDTFLFDIKAIDEQTHVACTGVSNKQILENLRYVDSLGIPIEIRYPYVPTMNDMEDERIACFVKDLKHVTCLRVLPYHSYAERKYARMGLPYPLPNVPVPTKEEISAVVEKLKKCGLANVSTF
ncbi:MAG: glycyl-radical enzyme activating protein [Clostridia bacterium]|nr:glycyl-radical enzyme activating protein [Clostridia bacterium]